MTDTEQAPAGLDLDRMVDAFDTFDHDTAQHLFKVINHARPGARRHAVPLTAGTGWSPATPRSATH